MWRRSDHSLRGLKFGVEGGRRRRKVSSESAPAYGFPLHGHPLHLLGPRGAAAAPSAAAGALGLVRSSGGGGGSLIGSSGGLWKMRVSVSYVKSKPRLSVFTASALVAPPG